MGNQTKRVNAHEDRLRALELRKKGLSYREIGAEIGKSSSQAHKYVARALQETTAEAVDDLRRLEGERLDKLQNSLWQEAISGNHGAVDRVLRVMERRAKLLGLDAPSKQEVSGALNIVMDWGDSADGDDSTA